MSRFTTKIDNEYIVGVSVGECGWTDVAEEKQYEANQKLGKLEDLEEQLGCPLEVVVKALEYGIYAKDLPREDLIKQFGLKLSNIETEWYLINNIMCVNLKDYKISFWLKEDKSE